jgi:urease accessory protein
MREGENTETARRLRKNLTEAERRLWSHLRNRQLAGLKFRRQSSVGPYIADFLCHEQKLIVEVDGGQHADDARDDPRTRFLESEGFRVLRFWNNDVLANTDGILQRIAASVEDIKGPGEILPLDYTARHFRRRIFDIGDRRVTVDLPEARIFTDGETVEAVDGTLLTIRAADEDLLEVTGPALPRIAWHIGNRHTPCQVEDTRLLIQRDHVLKDMLEKLGATVREVCEPFQPEGGAYGHGRTHGHSHSHDPHEDPNAHIHDHE